jgi:two-component sensor histidine kinase
VVGYREEGAGWRLCVHDNGGGLPFDDNAIATHSFGRQLIATLVSRINAEITYTSDGGTKVDVFCGVTS